MIDNRPKVHRPKKALRSDVQTHQAEQPAVVHIDPVNTTASPAAGAPVKAKAVPAMPLSGILSGGLGSLGILPVVLIISALQKGRSLPIGRQANPAAQQLALPAVPVAAPVTAAVPGARGGVKAAEIASVKAAQVHSPATAAADPLMPAPAIGPKQRNQLRSYKKPVEPAKAPDPEPVPVSTPKPVQPPRPQPRPADIKNLLSDLAGYLPGTGNVSVARVSKIMGIADELRSIDNSGSVYAASLPANPLDRHIGLLNVLGRNLPMSGASNIGRASQVLSLVNTIKGGSGGGQNMGNMAGMLGGLMGGQNMGSMAGMLGGLMGSQSQPQQQPEMKNVTPSQAEGIKDTVNRLLSGMDDKQKSELLDKAKDFLGKSKK